MLLAAMRPVLKPRPGGRHSEFIVLASGSVSLEVAFIFPDPRIVRGGRALDIVYIWIVHPARVDQTAQPFRLRIASGRRQQQPEDADDHEDEAHDAQVNAEVRTGRDGKQQDRADGDNEQAHSGVYRTSSDREPLGKPAPPGQEPHDCTQPRFSMGNNGPSLPAADQHCRRRGLVISGRGPSKLAGNPAAKPKFEHLPGAGAIPLPYALPGMANRQPPVRLCSSGIVSLGA
jgi:hypothetical protein